MLPDFVENKTHFDELTFKANPASINNTKLRRVDTGKRDANRLGGKNTLAGSSPSVMDLPEV